MALEEIDDREEIAAFCRRRPAVHAYELGDLDDFFWPHTRWFGWRRFGRLSQVALLYSEHELPVLIALADDPEEEMGTLLGELLPRLPARIYAHVTPPLVAVLAARYAVESHGVHLKMNLARHNLLSDASAELLSPADLGEVASFYEQAYPGTWFVPRMLESGRYVGLREEGRLVCVAGVHVWSPRFGVAAIGNVATLPSQRGRGLAQRACSRLCRLLLADGIETIGLNVHGDNSAAVSAYTRLGFERVAEYEEVLLQSHQR